jgi:hypothetical protein
MSLSTAEIEAQVRRVLDSDPTANAIAIRTKAKQTWPNSLIQQGRDFQLRWCDSPLAMREALCEAEQHDQKTSGLILITPLATHELAEDVTARLARARVFQPEGWEIVRHFFQAKETDSRLGRYAWLPQALIDGASQGPYPPVANGFLNLDSAWREVLNRFLGIDSARPDAIALLIWSMDHSAGPRLALLSEPARVDVMNWMSETAGVVGNMLLGCIEADRTIDALPLGLVCGVLFSPDGEGQTSLGQAAIRLERFVNGKHVGVAEGRAWSQAAEQVVRMTGLDVTRAQLERADALLNDLRVSDFAQLSNVLPSALDQRLRGFAAALTTHATNPTEQNLEQVELYADRALAHALLANQKTRMERVEMARRLARWLMIGIPADISLQAAVAWQADQGAFVDWARFRLLGGDELPDLSHAFSACRSAVIARRNAFAKQFAQALVQWNIQKPATDKRVIPLESVLENVLAPFAASNPVLLLVMDGLSTSIFRELFTRISSLGWTEMVPLNQGKPLVGVAAIPTITEVSRASLLCGRLTVGASAQEKPGFASNAALIAHSRAEAPPKLFHKGELADETNLAPEVRAAIANTQQRVVGVVYNAIDDHLSGPDQLHQRWGLEDLRLLLPLLHEARESRRVLVITADHGHLLEDGTTQIKGGDSDRWRLGSKETTQDELAISGGRVVTSDGSNSVVCLWGESTRYAGRKNGYHGGLSPQEVTVPLGVFVPIGLNLADWTQAPPAQPEWWELPPISKLLSPQALPAVSSKPSKRKLVEQPAQPHLFEPDDFPSPEPVAVDWISALLASQIYVSQRQLAARVAPPDDKMRLILTCLSERGGKLSRTALAHRLSLPEVRIGGLLSAVRRLLNVDQASVLIVDETAGTVELNTVLLHQQFQLPNKGGQQ